jgi:hypothetical protein
MCTCEVASTLVTYFCVCVNRRPEVDRRSKLIVGLVLMIRRDANLKPCTKVGQQRKCISSLAVTELFARDTPQFSH